MKIAQIGVANFGARRRQIMRESGLFELVAAYDLNAEALKQCQAEDGARPVASYAELLTTPGIEAVVISTGAKFHAEQIIAAAEKGLHVFVEKPLCSTPAEVAALLAMQQRTGVVIGLGHADHRHQALSLRVKGLIDSGELGKVATFEKTTAHNGGLQIKPGDWRGDPAKNPGGMLFQCGVHGFHELMFYFGPITEVSALMRFDVHTTQTADVALCHLKFASGLIGTLNAYHVTPYRHTLNILGTKANLYRDERFFDEGTTLLIQRTGVPGAKEHKEPVAIDNSLTDDCGGMRSFYYAVRKGGPCYPSLLDGARAVGVVFAAEESARSGHAVAVTALSERERS
jgi:predicted dehydrogenase